MVIQIERVQEAISERLIRKYRSKELKGSLAIGKGLLAIGKEIYQVLLAGATEQWPLELHLNSEKHLDEFCFPYELITSLAGVQLILSDNNASLVRILLDKDASQQKFSLPVNILIVTASPNGLPPINGEAEINRIRMALGAYNGRLAKITEIKGFSTEEQIQKACRQPHQIVEFIVHGTDDSEEGGVVLLEDERGDEHPMNGNSLQALLSSGNYTPNLVLLNSCLTSGTGAPTPGWFSNVTWHLLVSGVPAVVAMQARVKTDLAAKAGAVFYQKLFSPVSLDECVRAMRLCLKEEWFAPVLVTRRGFDRQVFTEEAKQRLERLAEINQDVDRLYDRLNDSYDDLIQYLKNLDNEEYSLVHKCNNIATKILENVAEKLGILM